MGCSITMLNMLFLPTCPLCAYSESIHAVLDSFITMHSRKESPFAPRPLPSAPAGSSGSESRWRRQLRITAAACRRSAGRKPSSNPAAPSVGKMVCARRREAQGNLWYPFLSSSAMYSLTVDYLVGNLVELRVPGVGRLVVDSTTFQSWPPGTRSARWPGLRSSPMLSTLLLTAALCQHRQFQTQARCKSLLRKHKELNLIKKFSC